MGKPVWVTRAGNLGTLEEGVFYELLMEAFDPDGGELEYKVIAGYMPPGLVMNERTGMVSGRPKDLYLIRGVPFEVSEDVTSTFCCRLVSEDGKIADRTFSITITGQDAPTIITPESELARIFDGTYVEIPLEAEDLDREPLTWKVNAGSLPPGLSLDPNTGVISGYTQPVISVASESTVGWDATDAGWEEYPWSHSPAWINQNYQFTVEVTDGKEYAQRSYSIFVLSKSLLTADLDTVTADSDSFITADMDNKHRPALVTTSADLGIYEHDNYFAYKFEGIDFDFDQFEYGVVSGDGNGFDSILGSGFDSELFDQGSLSLPPGLTLNAETGWLYGYIQSQIAAQTEYSFAAYVYKKDDPAVRSELVYFTVTIVGDLANAVIWQTPNNLGSISTGAISELAIESVNQVGLSVNYSLESGSSLPQGLKLLSSGLIVGRASFEYTSFDKGITTFDENIRELGARLAPVTFDQTYTFTVKAASSNNALLAYRTFTVSIVPSDYEPYESLYLKANPGQVAKDLFLSISKNTDIIPAKDVYRNGDPYFGRAADTRLLLLSGLAASSAEDYIAAMGINHYRKALKFGEPKLSKAYDENQNIVYEVLYYELVDDSETAAGSVSKSINLVNKINRNITIDTSDVKLDSTYYTMDGSGDRVVYPNSLINMRQQLMSTIGMSVREVLPKWMSNRQADGSIIGWKPVVIISYLKPGTGDRALFNLKRRTDLDQKTISFDFDRYIWDNNLSKTYDANTGEYLTSAETTFDITANDKPNFIGTINGTVKFKSVNINTNPIVISNKEYNLADLSTLGQIDIAVNDLDDLNITLYGNSISTKKISVELGNIAQKVESNNIGNWNVSISVDNIIQELLTKYIKFKGAYFSINTYQVGDIVVYQNKYWKSLTVNNLLPSSGPNWELYIGQNVNELLLITSTFADIDATISLTANFSDNSNVVATVDFALDVPFNQIDGRLTDYIDNLGGLDGLVTVYEGKTLIFATQEQFVGYNEPNEGWIRPTTLWDDENGWDAENSVGWDDYTLVDGYQQKQADPSEIVNQRAGVWKIVRNPESGLLRLEFQQEIDPDQTVFVRNGFRYGGYLLKYDGIINFSTGKTVPYYKSVEEVEQNNQTTFDHTQTRFITNVVTYEDPDQSDKYLVFPRTNIWA